MSTTASIANFAVDMNGKEVPIRYRAEDLVNKAAPEGYVWQRRTELRDIMESENPTEFDLRFASNTPYYIAVRVSE